LSTTASPEKTRPIALQASPESYRHWRLALAGDVATLTMAVEPEGGAREGYELKLNSYDLGVDVELADLIQRLRFEHPEVRCLVLTGALERVFCAGANIVMLRTSTHAFKVNFCKFTNETRLALEDASEHSGLRSLAALNGTASGGGYELALACDRILLVDDRSSAVSFPEVPLLGVLPGTGGLTRIADKRKIRRDRSDFFGTVAEGIKGKRAVEWGLVDRLAPLSRWDESVRAMARELADAVPQRAGSAEGVVFDTLEPELDEGDARRYRHVELAFDRAQRTVELTLRAPDEGWPGDAAAAHAEGASWWVLRAFRELDLALLDLRMNEPEIGLVLVRAEGPPAAWLETDALLAAGGHWFVLETRHLVKRVLKRLENSAKSFYAVADAGTCFVGTGLELALACDRIYLLDDPAAGVLLGTSPMNAGLLPMANGLSRLATRFLADPPAVERVLAAESPFDAAAASELGLATVAPDAIDWEDELRLAIEERASLSPDALTGMESNLRFAGPETLETKIFGRLSAWQNWIFQRPNAVGARGALTCYGTPTRPEFDPQRT
jgi:benzoyl-CoA-dihydrodiol lyase